MSFWFITGISRGLGFALAREVLGRGHTVVGTTRDGHRPGALDPGDGRLHAVALDVRAPEQAETAVLRTRELAGRLDYVVNNAGYGLLGSIEEATPEEAAEVFDVNFFGTLRVVRAALPLLRRQGSGHIVNITSIAGLAPAAGSGLYAAAKSAVEGLSESLAAEVAPLGIKVTAVAPGAFRTEFLSQQSIRVAEGAIADYDATAGATVRHLADMAGGQLGDPDRGAAVIVDALLAEHPPLHLVLGADAIDRARANTQRLEADISTWENPSRATAFA